MVSLGQRVVSLLGMLPKLDDGLRKADYVSREGRVRHPYSCCLHRVVAGREPRQIVRTGVSYLAYLCRAYITEGSREDKGVRPSIDFCTGPRNRRGVCVVCVVCVFVCSVFFSLCGRDLTYTFVLYSIRRDPLHPMQITLCTRVSSLHGMKEA